MMQMESIRDSVGTGPGVVLWCYREGGGPGVDAGNPFAEMSATVPEVLYRRCFNIVQPPACRFPMVRFEQILPKFRVVMLHNPEVFVDLMKDLPELAKACMGHDTRLVLISEWAEFLGRCQAALEPLSELLPIVTVASGNGQRNAA